MRGPVVRLCECHLFSFSAVRRVLVTVFPVQDVNAGSCAAIVELQHERKSIQPHKSKSKARQMHHTLMFAFNAMTYRFSAHSETFEYAQLSDWNVRIGSFSGSLKPNSQASFSTSSLYVVSNV